MRSLSKVAALLAIAGATVSCQTQGNYSADGPRYEAAPPPHLVHETPADTLKIVSFNIAFAIQVDSALKVLRTDPEAKDADIILLQEMGRPLHRAGSGLL